MKAPHDTHQRLADAAEVLFAEKGIEGASLRDITKQAGVNLAAVNYHFGSKEGLLREVLGRRLNPVNSRRLSLLNELEATGDSSVESVLRAFLLPLLDPELAPSGHFIQLMSRMHTAHNEVSEQLLREAFAPVMQRYLQALGRLLPELSPAFLFQRMQFVIGAMVHSCLLNNGTGCHQAPVPMEPLDAETYLQQFVAFCGAGLRHA